MGEVYRATDTNLKRAVAIKVLPALVAADAERLARFQREAEVLASLNHPNIAAIYGLERSGATTALVMELVEGPTLADRIAQGAIPIDEALPIAKQIAEALEAAHEQGIIHRDLKPANIKVRSDGTVKVLDFGLAKAMEPPGAMSPSMSMSPTITTPALMTGAGMILGTAAYMSPEQARGKAVDKRADIWAFGAVLFEMLTGKRAFPGEDLTDTLAAVAKLDPPWDAIGAGVPARLRQVLRVCLQKDPKQRAQAIGDVRLVLEGAFDVPAPAPQPSAEALGTTLHWRSPTVGAAALALILVTAVATWVLKPPASERPAPLRRFTISTGQAPVSIGTRNRDMAITPDGSRLIYFAGLGTDRQLYIRALDALEGTPIRQADRFFEPFVSPDGRWVGFNDEAALMLRKMPIAGGPPVTITAVGRELLGATWGPDDTIVFATTEPGTGLQRVPAGGGTPTVLTTPDKARGEIKHAWPEFLPGGRAVLYTIQSGERGEDFQIAVIDIQSGDTKILVPSGSSPRFSPSGHLVYAAENTIRAVPFDPVRLEVLGDPIPLAESVLVKRSSGAADFSVAADGTLVYIAAGAGGLQRRLVWAERGGARRPINAPPRAYTTLRISPDGTRVALATRDQQSDIWIWDFARETLTRLTTDPSNDFAPIWTRDGRRIVFSSSRVTPSALFVQAADGTGGTERLIEGAEALAPNTFSPDGKRLIFRADTSTATGQDLRMLVLDGERRITPLIQTPFDERNADISPDGKWLGFQSNESGTDEVYVRPFPDVESGRWQVSKRGGFHPAWAPNGRELFYVAADGRLMAVDVRSQGGFAVGVPRMLVDGGFYFNLVPQGRSYDVSPDGTRFLLIEAPNTGTQADTAGLTVVLNWQQELKRLAPSK
jgi:eukaryotic-like serine/threonine-protein kinase